MNAERPAMNAEHAAMSAITCDNRQALFSSSFIAHRSSFLIKLSIMLCGLFLVWLGLRWRVVDVPRVWAARDVPVAFWAWRTEAPTAQEVSRVARETGARTLFLHAGQIHDEDGTLKRVRAVEGYFPRGIELHLVYNSTPKVLAEFERLDAVRLAGAIVEAFERDRAVALVNGASVAGLQLDIDAPTRLLAHYARVVRAVRARLPASTRLSVTGLPTWMESVALRELLAAVDFWIPQCYGATIPRKLEQAIAISSQQSVARAVARARAFGKPFYAGLSAYGYALLYDASGALVALRGDMDPALIAQHASLQLVSRSSFESAEQSEAATEEATDGATAASEWRYVYRARGDALVDGLIIRAGDSLVLDIPSGASLRESARAVRLLAGEQLLGLCIFRLPGEGDPSTLSLAEVAAALADAAPASRVEVQAELSSDGQARAKTAATKKSVRLTATNSGNMSALFGADALTMEVRVPAGSVRAVRPGDFNTVEALCERTEKGASDEGDRLQPCAERRASVIRFRSSAWTPAARAAALVSFSEAPPLHLAARVVMRRDDGREWAEAFEINVGGDER
jgi:hypothetical protein